MSSNNEQYFESFYYCSGCNTSLFKKLEHLFEHRKTCPELLLKIKNSVKETKNTIKEKRFLEEIQEEIDALIPLFSNQYFAFF